MQCVWTTDADYKAFCSLLRGGVVNEDAVQSALQEWLNQETSGVMSIDMQQMKGRELYNRLRGLDFLTPFLEELDVSELMLNGLSDLFIEKGSRRLHYKMDISEERIYALIQRIVSSVNRAVNLKEPIVDARLKDGSRVHIVLKPIAINGPILTIRKFKKSLNNLNVLEANGCFDGRMTAYLKSLVQSRKSIFVSGSTSSGKTTLLNCLCREINKSDRVITIEDSAELDCGCIENLVSLETRVLKQQDLSQISMTELIRASLRMRPDRIIVGEIRGAEAHDMLQAMNTGHEGSMSTGHANSAKDMLQRIETMALASGLTTVSAIRQQIASGIDYVIHLERQQDGVRRLVELVAINDVSEKGLTLKTIFHIDKGWQL